MEKIRILYDCSLSGHITELRKELEDLQKMQANPHDYAGQFLGIDPEEIDPKGIAELIAKKQAEIAKICVKAGDILIVGKDVDADIARLLIQNRKAEEIDPVVEANAAAMKARWKR